VTSPFEDEEARFLVLRAVSGAQVCLWPAWAAIPEGWTVVHGPTERAACLGWIESSA
jgi:MbtH protein